MDNHVFDLLEIVFVPKLDAYGKIVDVSVNGANNTEYTIVFDTGDYKSFLGYEIERRL